MFINEIITVPAGQCFKWAYLEYIKNPGEYTLVHATVHPEHRSTPYKHAWVEDGTKVYDWQTMELGASNYAKVGWPKKIFYQYFRPTNIKVYTGPVGSYYKKYSHTGPWD